MTNKSDIPDPFSSVELFEEHAKECPRINMINELFRTSGVDISEFNAIEYDGIFNPVNDSSKRAKEIGRLSTLFYSNDHGCDGPIEGKCPLSPYVQRNEQSGIFSRLARILLK